MHEVTICWLNSDIWGECTRTLSFPRRRESISLFFFFVILAHFRHASGIQFMQASLDSCFRRNDKKEQE